MWGGRESYQKVMYLYLAIGKTADGINYQAKDGGDWKREQKTLDKGCTPSLCFPLPGVPALFLILSARIVGTRGGWVGVGMGGDGSLTS